MLTLLFAKWTPKDLRDLLDRLDRGNDAASINDVRTPEDFHAWLARVQQQSGSASSRPMAAEQGGGTGATAARRRNKATVPDFPVLKKAWDKARSLHKWATDQGLFVLGRHDELFPVGLRKIPHAPALIFVKGDVALLRASDAVAIVGTRKPTPIGERLARETAEWFAKHGVVVVSGLAEGCDTAAHQGCLAGGGRTVAVLAQGLETPVYPASNRLLAREIVERGGCLVSEYLPYERPRRYYFVERDRLQSALSTAVVVAETGRQGGTMHTVKYAKHQGKPVACLVPTGEEFRAWQQCNQAQGNIELIHDGAMKLTVERLDRFWQSVTCNRKPLSAVPPGGADVLSGAAGDPSASREVRGRKDKRSDHRQGRLFP